MVLFQMRAPFSRRAAPNSAGEPFLRVPIGLNSGGIIETQAANDTSAQTVYPGLIHSGNGARNSGVHPERNRNSLSIFFADTRRPRQTP